MAADHHSNPGVPMLGKWPNPDCPGEPAAPMDDGFHWLRWPRTGNWTVGRWSPDIWCWSENFRGHLASPEEMAHLDYVCRLWPPA